MEMIHHHFKSLSSTNDWAKRGMKLFPRDKLTLVSADRQTQGRGQFGRKWLSSEEGNIYASFCFFIDDDKQDAFALTHKFATSLVHVLKELGITAHIKKPNDLLVNQKKIAGILCETMQFPPKLGIVIGIGLNVNFDKTSLETVGQPATSLKIETGKEWETLPLLNRMKDHFILNYNFNSDRSGTTTKSG